ASEFLRGSRNKIWLLSGCGIQYDLFCANCEYLCGGLKIFDAASIGQRHKALARNLRDHFQRGWALLNSCRNIKEYEFVDFLLIEYPDCVDRIANIFGIFETDGL